jgi:hypothetical protein
MVWNFHLRQLQVSHTKAHLVQSWSGHFKVIGHVLLHKIQSANEDYSLVFKSPLDHHQVASQLHHLKLSKTRYFRRLEFR